MHTKLIVVDSIRFSINTFLCKPGLEETQKNFCLDCSFYRNGNDPSVSKDVIKKEQYNDNVSTPFIKSRLITFQTPGREHTGYFWPSLSRGEVQQLFNDLKPGGHNVGKPWRISSPKEKLRSNKVTLGSITHLLGHGSIVSSVKDSLEASSQSCV